MGSAVRFAKQMGSGLWILDFALQGWKVGDGFAGKPRREDGLVQAMKGQKWEQFRDRDWDWERNFGALFGMEILRIKTEGICGTDRRTGLSSTGNGAEQNQNPES